MIGPGGVGKTTVGKVLALQLGLQLFDLDEEFCKRIANIGVFIREHGYNQYLFQNSELCSTLIDSNSWFDLSETFPSELTRAAILLNLTGSEISRTVLRCERSAVLSDTLMIQLGWVAISEQVTKIIPEIHTVIPGLTTTMKLSLSDTNSCLAVSVGSFAVYNFFVYLLELLPEPSRTPSITVILQ